MNLISLTQLGTAERIGLVAVIALTAHLGVYGIRYLGHQLMAADTLLRWNKLRTLAGLFMSITVFGLYFAALGFVLQEFGVSLTAYLASASILGLAIGFQPNEFEHERRGHIRYVLAQTEIATVAALAPLVPTFKRPAARVSACGV